MLIDNTLRFHFQKMCSTLALFTSLGLFYSICASFFHLFRNRYLAYGLYRVSILSFCSIANTAVLISISFGVLAFILSLASMRKRWSLGGLVVIAIDIVLLGELFFLMEPLARPYWLKFAIGCFLFSVLLLLLASPSVRTAHRTSEITNYLIIANIASILIGSFTVLTFRKSCSYFLSTFIDNLPKGLNPSDFFIFILRTNVLFVLLVQIIKNLSKRVKIISPLIFSLANISLPLITMAYFERKLLLSSAQHISRRHGSIGLWQGTLGGGDILASNFGFFAFSVTAGLLVFFLLKCNFIIFFKENADKLSARRGACTFFFALLIFMALINAGGFFATRPERATSDKPNLILISIDTLRADHLGCYGYAKDTSPHIDRLSNRGVTFSNVITQSNSTSPSHASILTSLYPIKHGVRGNCWTLDDSMLTLAEYLRNFGYTTAAFISQFNLDKDYGFSQGFQTYADSSKIKPIAAIAEDTTELVLRWLEQNYSHKFFLFIHYFDPHMSYTPPDPYNKMFDPDYQGILADGYDYPLLSQFPPHSLPPEEVKHAIALYDGEIRYVDDNIGKILDFLSKHNLMGNTIIAVLSDHGEGMYEHGYFNHAVALFNGELRVPCIISCPGLLPEGLVVRSNIELIDILPTVTKLMVNRVPPGIDGRDLMPLISAPDEEEMDYCFSEDFDRPELKAFSVIKGRWKYIYFKDTEKFETILRYLRSAPSVDLNIYSGWLFDLKNDPEERENIIAKYPAIQKELNAKITDWLKEKSADSSFHKGVAKERIEQLKALGYLNSR